MNPSSSVESRTRLQHTDESQGLPFEREIGNLLYGSSQSEVPAGDQCSTVPYDASSMHSNLYPATDNSLDYAGTWIEEFMNEPLYLDGVSKPAVQNGMNGPIISPNRLYEDLNSITPQLKPAKDSLAATFTNDGYYNAYDTEEEKEMMNFVVLDPELDANEGAQGVRTNQNFGTTGILKTPKQPFNPHSGALRSTQGFETELKQASNVYSDTLRANGTSDSFSEGHTAAYQQMHSVANPEDGYTSEGTAENGYSGRYECSPLISEVDSATNSFARPKEFHDDYTFDFEDSIEPSNSVGHSDKAFSAPYSHTASYETSESTPSDSSASGLGIYVKAPKTHSPNGRLPNNLPSSFGSSSYPIVPGGGSLHLNLSGKPSSAFAGDAQYPHIQEAFSPYASRIKHTGEFHRQGPLLVGEYQDASPPDCGSPYMSYSSSGSTDDSFGSRFSNDRRFRHRSISKIPLREIYSMMGLSHDHNKAKWREERIIAIAQAEGFDVGNQTWIRDTEESKRARIIESIQRQTKEFGYPAALIEAIVRRGTYARMQSKLRQKRRHNKRTGSSSSSSSSSNGGPRQIAC